jgi:hypothetical protein
MGKVAFRILAGFLAVVAAFSSGRAATLTAMPTNVVATIDLSAEGTHDWAHWGLEETNLFNRKLTALPRISNISLLGTAPVQSLTNTPTVFTWTNGTPVTATNTTNQLLITGVDSGFEIVAGGDTTTRSLKLCFGLVAASAIVEASLSDGSAAAFTTNVTSLEPTNLAYAFTYSAASAQQTLRVRVTTTAQLDTNAALLLGAATLVRVSSNQAPSVTLLSPTNEPNVLLGDPIFLNATASDNDGIVTRVEFFTGTTKIGEATNAPYSFLWTNAPIGSHVLTAKVFDDEGTNRTSAAATIFVITTGGLVAPVFSAPTGTVNLTLEGAADWVHWGLITESTINRKAGVAPMISTFSIVGSGPAFQFFDNFNGYTWTDGTPRAGITNTTTGVYIFGVGNGFEIQAPATNVFRTLRVHVGTYAGRGRLRAFLTDFSAPVVSDLSVNNIGNGPGGIYTITYRAATPGQKLVVRYTLAARYAVDGNATLQAASLQSDNNPPTVTLITPTNGTAVLAGTNVVLSATASDSDGTVAQVEFYRNNVLVGTSTNAPFTVTLTNVPLGNYLMTARAVDNKGAFAVSPIALLHVITGTGFMRGTMTNPAAAVNLTREGMTDWMHWGLEHKNSVNRRAGIVPVIGQLSLIGNEQRYTDNFSSFSWSNGTPTLTTVNSRTGLYVAGLSNGFQIAVPASTRPQRLNVYAGVYGSRSRFEATLSDNSAAPFINNALTRNFANGYAVYTVDFAAGSSNQVLTVRYFAETLQDIDFGNVTWQAVALMPYWPTIIAHQPPQPGATFSGQFFALQGINYTVERSDAITPASWQPLTNMMGTSSNAMFYDWQPLPTRFYRVRVN